MNRGSQGETYRSRHATRESSGLRWALKSVRRSSACRQRNRTSPESGSRIGLAHRMENGSGVGGSVVPEGERQGSSRLSSGTGGSTACRRRRAGPIRTGLWSRRERGALGSTVELGETLQWSRREHGTPTLNDRARPASGRRQQICRTSQPDRLSQHGGHYSTAGGQGPTPPRSS
ncbi:UNVERIFIED_CONTAM: hypothetical protein FKN15_016748 [Acipenser sinensis]